MAKEVNEILLSAQSVDVSVCKHAEERLKQLEEQDPSIYLSSLSAELADDKNPVGSRKLAGLLLKNAFYAELTERWLSLDDVVKTQIEGNLSRTLKSRVYEARFTALQVIAKVVGMRLPQEQWLELIGELSGSLLPSSHQVPPHVKQASLETLGYLCEEVSSCADLGGDEVRKKITKAIVQGMNASEASNDVRLAATRALYSVLGIAIDDFTNDTMEAIWEAVVSTDVKIQQAAFECLVCISTSYYGKLGPYVVEKMLNVTRKALKADEEPVALQAIEIWSLICNKETDYLENYKTIPCFHYIKQALPGLVPMLLETLLKQELEDQDDGAWNVAMAGRRCLGLVARTVGDDIVPLVRPFIEENIKKPDWRQREAATYAFGSILEGPSQDELVRLHVEVVTLSLMLKTLTKDPNKHVKDTTAWTLRRIFVHLYDSISVTPADCQEIITVLLSSMKTDAPNVAEKACGTLFNVVEWFDYKYQLNGLTSSLEEIVQPLLTVTHREDAGESRLRSAACETLKKVVWCFPMEEVLQLLLIIKKELQETLEEQKEQNEPQELLCWCLDHIFLTLAFSSSFKQHADDIMNLFFEVVACPSATGHEEAMRAVGTLADALRTDFVKYMPDFYKCLEKKLRDLKGEGYAVTVDVVGSIFKALKGEGLTWSDSVMHALVEHYEQVDPSVKPLVLSCFGDIAYGIGDHFNKYFEQVFPLLHSAVHQCGGGDDDEIVNLKIAAMNASFNIFNALKKWPEFQKKLLPFVQKTLDKTPRFAIPRFAILRDRIQYLG